MAPKKLMMCKVARFCSVQHNKTGQNVPKYPKISPNGLKIDQVYQHRPLQDPPKFTHIWIFGFKIYHLATLTM
jgi:hypothetical protein